MKQYILKHRLLRRLLSDKTYIHWQYQQCLNKPLNLRNPQTFNEKIQWIKLNWRVPILTQCADKFEVRNFVQGRIGPESLKQLYGVYRRPDEIVPDELPEKFMLKANHGCGQNIPCDNKTNLDWELTRRRLKHFLRRNLYQHGREWSYKNIAPRIICEEYLEGKPLVDYNIFCFDGVPHFLEVIVDRLGDLRVNMFDLDWNIMERKYETPPTDGLLRKPARLRQMLKDATELARGFPFVRVDFFDDGRKYFFGEMTFYPYNGLNRFKPDSFDLYLGTFLKLPARSVQA